LLSQGRGWKSAIPNLPEVTGYMKSILDHTLIIPLRKLYRGPSTLCALLSLLFVCSQLIAQTTEPNLRKVLAQRAAFGAAEIAAVERGEPVAKLLPANDPREVAVVGVIELPSDAESALKAFQLSMRLEGKSNLESGKFSNVPRVDDLGSMTLSDGDIADLKTCTVGDCKLKLSAAMIQRFQKTIDWNASDYREQANQLFRLMIVEYVTAYLQKGDAALIEYADQSVGLPLAREQNSLLANLLYINDAAPELVRHLKAFPQSPVPVERSLSWAKVDFGLKPVVVITDTSTYRSEVAGARRVLVLSKQIYANHYFDASLSLTAAIGNQTRTKSDLLYVNRSRSSALASTFSKFKHKIVEGRVTEDLRDLLRQTRINLDVVLNNSAPSLAPTFAQRIVEMPVLRIVSWLVLLTVIGKALSFKVRRKMRPLGRAGSSKPSEKLGLPQLEPSTKE
jgi:hypothetical protein